MKKTLLLLSFVTFIGTAQVTSYPWMETFEDDSPTSSQWVCEHIAGTNNSVPSGLFWKIHTATSVGYYTSQGAYEGTKMAVFDTRTHTRDAVARFISPELDLSNLPEPKLRFYYRNMQWSGDQNELEIYYRTASDAEWNLITTFNTNVTSWSPSGYISLPEVSETYQLALVGIGKYGYGLDVDNLEVVDGTLSTNEVIKTKSAISVYPNPAADFVYIKSELAITEVTILDSTGKQISFTKDINAETKIPVHDLQSGFYIIQTKNSEGIISIQKFLKN